MRINKQTQFQENFCRTYLGNVLELVAGTPEWTSQVLPSKVVLDWALDMVFKLDMDLWWLFISLIEDWLRGFLGGLFGGLEPYNEFITCFHESLIYETWICRLLGSVLNGFSSKNQNRLPIKCKCNFYFLSKRQLFPQKKITNTRKFRIRENMWWLRTLSVEKVGVLGLWGTFDKAALEMVAYKDFTESRKLAFGPPALFEFDALISDAAPLDVSLKWKEENMIYWKLY